MARELAALNPKGCCNRILVAGIGGVGDAPVRPNPTVRAAVVPATVHIQDNGRMSTLHPDRELMELIDRVAAQDDSALKALYERTSSKLFGLALRIVRQRDAAEDVLQDAFVAIWRGAGSYRASLSPPMAWMGLIVRSRALDALRKRTTDRSDVTDELDDLLSDTLEGDGANPMDVTEASEQAFALHQCLAKLDGKQREVVSLAYLRDQSHSELAEQLKLPLGTVKTWIRRGLDQLRNCMARYV
ncbi:RNA polymerase sigma-70 factor (ECF subfamily) [Acidovorax sp. 106]|nr:RNA polymerase sigma-70 factor (ECF subfamily) [Acidovorax sp. 106]